MTSQESAKNPIWLCDDTKVSQEIAIVRFAVTLFPGRNLICRPDGGYQFEDGIKVYRVTLYKKNGYHVWGVYRDVDAENELVTQERQ